METTAHPDDEDNALLSMLSHGQGMRTVLVSATRGDGGQNEIGPELFQALGVLRSEELLAVHRFDGAEQYYTRAVDFGFSFSVEETLEKWGRDEIVGDFVRHMRMIRPDVVAGFLCGGEGGGQHHQASALLTAEAFRAAADPMKYSEQIQEGLRPWQPRRLFCTDPSTFDPPRASHRPVPPHLVITDMSVFDTLLGRTYAELGLEARSMHKCQGTSQLLLLPGQTNNRTYRLMDTADGSARAASETLFAGIDTSLVGLGRFAPVLAGTLRPALTIIAGHVEDARAALDQSGPAASTRALSAGLLAVRQLRERLKASSGPPDEAYEVDFRLAQKESEFAHALVLASGVRFETLAADGLVIPGQTVSITVHGASHSPEPVAIRRISFPGAREPIPECRGTLERGSAFACKADILVPEGAGLSSPYWKPRADAARYDFEAGVPFGVSFTPTPFAAMLDLTVAGAEVQLQRTIEFRYDHIIAGEKRMDLQVVPPFAVGLTPQIAVVPSAAPAPREIDVRVTNHTRGPAAATVTLRVPQGWSADPASAHARFAREDEQVSLAFVLTPPPGVRAGEHVVSALVRGDAPAPFQSSVGYQVIEYPHIRRRHVVEPAESRLKVIGATIASGLRVGYVMGVGDQVPSAIEQLGAEVRLIAPEELASGDLSRYHAIVTGVRAYERRADLRANNHRLLRYAENGGIVLVQYNKFEFNEAQYGPYPAKVSSNRVTDENSPVEVLVPGHPVFARPNAITESSWTGWVQERGLYFLGERDPRYVDLIRLADPFPYNSGPKTGALVEAKVGKGRWIYIGLGLWRQLPAGTEGAYQLMANLLSLAVDR